MLSAGLLGGPGIGFQQDHFASESLKQADAAVYEHYKAEKANVFLGLETVGLDGAKVGVLEDRGKEAVRALEVLQKDPRATSESVARQKRFVEWWDTAKLTADHDKPLVTEAGLFGGRTALKLTALVPAVMALIYLGMILHFKARGGYRPQVLISKHEEALLMTGGVAGPAEF
jgi:hypothetical protein